MNIDITVAAEIAKVTLKLKQLGPVTIRRCKMAFDREFDDEIAAALGDDAKKALASLRAGGVFKVFMGIDAIDARASLGNGGGDNIAIDSIIGDRAIFTGPKEDGAPPMVRMEFECNYTDDVWSYIGRNCGGVVQIEFKNRQGVLAGIADVTPIRPGAH